MAQQSICEQIVMQQLLVDKLKDFAIAIDCQPVGYGDYICKHLIKRDLAHVQVRNFRPAKSKQVTVSNDIDLYYIFAFLNSSIKNSYMNTNKKILYFDMDNVLVDFRSGIDCLERRNHEKVRGTLRRRSLHLFMDECSNDIAIRIWSQPFSIDDVTAQSGKKFRLTNLPFYYAEQHEKILKQYI